MTVDTQHHQDRTFTEVPEASGMILVAATVMILVALVLLVG